MDIKPHITTVTYADIALRWDEDAFTLRAGNMADAAEDAAALTGDYPVKYPEVITGHDGRLLSGYSALLEELTHLVFQVSYDVGVDIETNNYWGLDIRLIGPTPQEVNEYAKRLGEALDRFAPWIRTE